MSASVSLEAAARLRERLEQLVGRRGVLAVDLHAAGEHGRVILSGAQSVPAVSMLEAMRSLASAEDSLRLRMLREPRGYPAANCNLVLPASAPEAACGFVIMEQVEYPLMSGSNTICVATALIETGLIAAREPTTAFVLETPAGLVGITAAVSKGRASAVTFENAPSFVFDLDVPINVPGIGEISVDLAYGGMIYVLADAEALGLDLVPENARTLVRFGEAIKAAAREQAPRAHPERPDVVGPTIACLTGSPSGPHADQKNAVVVSTGALQWDRPDTFTGALDRSPCGTATCARMAVLHARGQLALGQEFRNEGPLGTIFVGRLLRTAEVAGRPAVVPSITGSAYVTGYHLDVLDDADPFPTGYTLGDLWGANTLARSLNAPGPIAPAARPV